LPKEDTWKPFSLQNKDFLAWPMSLAPWFSLSPPAVSTDKVSDLIRAEEKVKSPT
jgi:hypothetical protein